MNYLEQLLAANEQILLVARQSWVVLIREALIALVLIAGIIGVAFVATGPFPQYWWLVGLLILLPLGRFIVQFLHWANREFVVTNRRVIQIDGLVNKNVVDSSLEKVNDVRMSQSVLGRLLNYGDVEILTASDLGSNLFQRIADPIGFKTAMLNAKEKMGYEDEGPKTAPPPGPRPADIPALIASLSAMRKEGMITEEEFQQKKQELLARM